jgi:hypothetical protein
MALTLFDSKARGYRKPVTGRIGETLNQINAELLLFSWIIFAADEMERVVCRRYKELTRLRKTKGISITVRAVCTPLTQLVSILGEGKHKTGVLSRSNQFLNESC